MRIRFLAGVMVIAVLALAGCGEDETTSPRRARRRTAGIDLVKDGKLTTCTHLPYPPFQSKQGDKVVGFDVDLVDLVAKELGVKQEIVDTPFEGIQSGEDLNTSKCDVAAAGMTINAGREKNLDFSDPYFEATQALMAKKGKPYRSLDDLKGKKLGVQQGTTGEEYAEEAGPRASSSVQFEDLGAAS